MSSENIAEVYMQRCLQLAKNGLGTTYPNPLVGSVIVHNGKIIAEGWHKKAGEPHAEVVAINQIKDKEILKNCSLFVNLEPCNHFGKTPACSEKIIEMGITKVFVGSVDPNPLVNKNGINRLLQAGVNVECGILEKECNELNKRFFTYQTKKRPYIILKWAENQLREIGSKNKKLGSVNISSLESKQLSHFWRSQEQAILVGSHTVLQDKPQLNIRLVSGLNPIRLVLDPKGVCLNSLGNSDAETHFFVQQNLMDSNNKNYIHPIDFQAENSMQEICKKLYELGIQSVIVEGGAYTLQKFLDADLWDEIRIFQSKTEPISEAVLAPKFDSKKHPKTTKNIGSDLLSVVVRED